MDRLEALRGQVTENQRAVLGEIWSYYCQRNRWMPCRVLHHRFGKAIVRAALEQLGGSVVFESRDHLGEQLYQLTFLGVLLTDQGHEAERLLIKYLQYLRDRYLADPEFNQVSHREVEAALNLTVDQLRVLGELIRLSRLWGYSAIFGEEGWTVGPPDNVDDLALVQDLGAYVREEALKDFDPTAPIGETERIKYFAGIRQEREAPNAFWFIRDPPLQQHLASDWREAQVAYKVQAWKSCAILCGGILEGMLLDALGREEPRAGEAYRSLKQKEPLELSRWGLADLVDVAERIGIFPPGAEHLSHALREFRDLIHPGRQLREKASITEDEAGIALSVVKICLKGLEAHRDEEH